ncbi:MAG: vanadium-dependent haloperoxidase [Gemmatimonadaceae bacterium]
MFTTRRRYSHSPLVLAAGALLACTDGSNQLVRPPEAQRSAVKFWDVTASTRWNRRVAGLLALRPPANAQAATSRILTYLSLAQYRAVLAAEEGKEGATHPSASAAVGAASVAVLSKFFPLDAASLEGQLDADRAEAQWPGARHEDVGAGEAIGRAVGADVNALAATDNYLVLSPGIPTPGPGYWVSSSAAIVRSLHGARPFFLTSASQLRAPPPPVFGSPEFFAALAEVRAISDSRTPEQLAIAQQWNTSSAPFTAGGLNLIADDLIEAHHRTEREAARILAYANAAAFDAQVACFDSKFTYWYIRPSQADPAITLPIGLPNHPSYPSAHSCITSAIMTVLSDALPSEKSRLDGIIEIAGLSRMYGGIHYRFDIDAGREIGREAAALALHGTLR